MSARAVLLLLTVVAACHRPEPAPARVQVEYTQTREHVDHYVAAGRTPAGFVHLAADLETVRGTADSRRAEDAELRLLALALPLVEQTRSEPIDVEVDRLALTVWPALLADPLTSPRSHDASPHADEDASAYIARLCNGVLAPRCSGIAPERHAVAVRAAVHQRAEQRMRDVLATCLMCSADPGWRELEWRWESLERAALRAALELPRAAGSSSAVAVGDALPIDRVR